MSRLCVYYRREPETDRWVPGDRYLRPVVRRIVRGARVGGIEKVVVNLRRGLHNSGVAHEMNLPFDQLRDDDRIAVLGRGRYALQGYDRSYPVVAGIGLMTHPSEWPTLCDDYPVSKYLQHSSWANELYRPYFGNRCAIWPVGIDTDAWRPAPESHKTVDFLLYDKVLWNRESARAQLLEPIRAALRRRRLVFREIRYGSYAESDYKEALAQSRAMIFLVEHESQGLAYQECLASGVPVMAWDQGRWLDPNRYRWGTPEIEATSVPYWDDRCGIKFAAAAHFEERLGDFLMRLRSGAFAPRDYIMENLTLERSTRRFLAILSTVYDS